MKKEFNEKIVELIAVDGKDRVVKMDDDAIIRLTGGTISWRNNNPGNLKFEYKDSADKTVTTQRSFEKALSDAQARYEGIVDLDQWGNAIFDTYENGRAAKIQLLERHSEKTVEELVKVYSVKDYTGETHYDEQVGRIYEEGDKQGVNLRNKKIAEMTKTELAVVADGIKEAEGWKVGERHIIIDGKLASQDREIAVKYENLMDLNSQLISLQQGKMDSVLTPADKIFFDRNSLSLADPSDAQQLSHYLQATGSIEKNASAETIKEAIESFQQRHGLTTEGADWSLALAELKSHYIAQREQEIIETINAERQAIAVLELEKANSISERLSELTDKKETLAQQVETKTAQLQALDRVESKLNSAELDATNFYSQIQADFGQANLSLSTPNKIALANKESLSLNDSADVKILQRVLIEDGLLKAEVTGDFRSQTQKALREALGKPGDYTFDTSQPLDRATLNQIAKPIESATKDEILEAVETRKTVLQTEITQTKAEFANTETSLSNIAISKTSIVEKLIATEQQKIAAIENQIKNYDQERIAPLNQIQDKLQAYALAVKALAEEKQKALEGADAPDAAEKNPVTHSTENTSEAKSSHAPNAAEHTMASGGAAAVNLVQSAQASEDQKEDSQAGANESTLDLPANPYAAVKDDLAAAQVSLLSQREREFYDADTKKNPFNPQNASDVEFVQNFLDKRGLLPQGETFGEWSEKTKEAIKAYQKTHDHLTPDGDPGKNTRMAMKEDHLASLDAYTIHKKVDTAKHLALENKDHDVAEMQAKIDASQNNLNTLQNEHNEVLSHQVEHYKHQKTDIDAQIQKVDRSIAEIDRIQEKLSTHNTQVQPPQRSQQHPESQLTQQSQQMQPSQQPTATTTPYAHIKPDLEKANISLATPAETTLSNYAQIDTHNTDQVKALQTVLHERGLFDKENIKGNFGPKTQDALCEALNIEDKKTFEHATTLNKETLTDLTESRLHKLTSTDLQKTLQSHEDQLNSQKQTLSTQQSSLNETLNQLEGKQQDSVSETTPSNTISSQHNKKVDSAESEKTYSSGDPHFDALVSAIESGDEAAYDKAVEDIENSDFGKAFRAEQEEAYQAVLLEREMERQRLEQEQRQWEKEKELAAGKLATRGMELDF